MTGIAFRTQSGKISRGMALGTLHSGMALGQREKIMIKGSVRPFETIYQMALRAVFRHPRLHMVGICCGHIVFPVAIDAVYSSDIKPGKAFRFVTIDTVRRFVCSKERKPAALMDTRYIGNQP
jgi:hypothetical protein